MQGDSTDSVTSSSIEINDNTTDSNSTGYHGVAVTAFGFWTLKLIKGTPVAK